MFTVEPSTALKGSDAERRPAGSTPPRRVRISLDGGDALKPVEPRPLRDEIPCLRVTREQGDCREVM